MLKYGIYEASYWANVPIENPLAAGSWIPFEEQAEFTSNDLNEIIDKLKSDYSNSFNRYKNTCNKERIRYYLYYILDSDGNVVGVLNHDNIVEFVDSSEVNLA